MNSNVGKIDKSIRIILGIILVAMFFVLDGSLKWFGLLGVIFLITALIGWCPLYRLFGITTRKSGKK